MNRHRPQTGFLVQLFAAFRCEFETFARRARIAIGYGVKRLAIFIDDHRAKAHGRYCDTAHLVTSDIGFGYRFTAGFADQLPHGIEIKVETKAKRTFGSRERPVAGSGHRCVILGVDQ